MTKITFDFKCAHSELLSIARSGIKSCRKYLTRFAKVSTRYTTTYLDELSAKVTAAASLPTAPLRGQSQVDGRIELITIAVINLSNCQMLKGYIERGAPDNQINSWIQAAGLGFYEKAAAYNWSSLQSMVNTGVLFIAGSLEALTVKGFMPATFQAQFTADRDSYIKALDVFYEAENDKVVATEKKTILYNEVYAEIIAIFKDGQKIFSNNEEAIRRQFVFDLILNKMKSGGAASIFGFITNTATQQPVEGVTVSSADKNYSAVSDVNGEYEITQVAADSYTLTFTKDGYEPTTQTIEVKKGTAAKADIALTAIEFALKIA